MTIATALLAASTIAAAQQDTTVRDTVILLEELVVSGTRSAGVQRIDQPLALSLTTPSIAERASGSVAAQLLRDIPGVEVQQTSAGQGAVILRGMVGNQVLMLVDGVPMNNGTYRDGPGQYLATIDPETIDRIEVIRGPASVLYGSDAQGGVVNIITKTHPYRGRASVHLATSGSTADDSYRGRLSAGYRGERWQLSLGGTLASVGDLAPGGDLAKQEPTAFGTFGLDASLRFRPTEQHTFDAAVQHFRMHDVPRYDRYVTFRAPAPGPDYEHVFDPQARQLAYARHTFDGRSPALTRLQTTVSLATQREGRNRIKLASDGGPADTRTHWRDDVYTPGIAVVGSSLAHLGATLISLTWGADWQHDVLASDGYDEDLASAGRVPLVVSTPDGPLSVGNFPDGAEADRLGVFLAADVPVGRAVSLSLGGRWSRFRNSANVGTDLGGAVTNTSSDLTGQIGLVLAPARLWRIAARVAEGFRAPNLYDLTRAGPVPGGIQLPNPDARPEHSLSGEVSLRYAAPGAAFDVTAYVTRVTDFIDRVPGEYLGDTLFDGERVFQGRNVATARIRGIEAEALTDLGPVRFRATLLYTYGEQESAGGVDEPMSKIPPVGGRASMRWTTPVKALWVEYGFRWALSQDRLGTRDLTDPRIPAGGTPSYAVHSVRAAAEVSPRLNLSVGFENLTDQLYRSHASGVDQAGRHVWVGVSVIGGI
jgi:hemoglobin/transferrin/lactoferrin receptor protein